jgi:2-amino-4-hydroxy-6-hydroxymethyldihydropteridine diphosphokinase
MEHSAYLALGSNLGDRMVNLAQALMLISADAAIQRCSRVFETPPWGYLDQPPFYNMVIEVETGLKPLELLRNLKHIEKEMGRLESVRYGPRLIDLDILFYDEIELHTPQLDIPHPRIAERAFVLAPLADLAADRTVPPGGQTVAWLLAHSDQRGITPVTLEGDGQPVDIAALFRSRPAVLERFASLSPARQREILHDINQASRPATRLKRFKRVAEALMSSKDL